MPEPASVLGVPDHDLGAPGELRCRVAVALEPEPCHRLGAAKVLGMPVAVAVLAAVALGVAPGPHQVQVGPRDEAAVGPDLGLTLDRTETGHHVLQPQDRLPPRLAAAVGQRKRPTQSDRTPGPTGDGGPDLLDGHAGLQSAVDHGHQVDEGEVPCELDQRVGSCHTTDPLDLLELRHPGPTYVETRPLHVDPATGRGEKYVRSQPVRRPPPAQRRRGEVTEAAATPPDAVGSVWRLDRSASPPRLWNPTSGAFRQVLGRHSCVNAPLEALRSGP